MRHPPTIEITASSFKLRANAPEGQKAISYQVVGKELDPKYWFSKISFKEAYTQQIWWPHLADRAGAGGAEYGVQPMTFAVHAEYGRQLAPISSGEDLRNGSCQMNSARPKTVKPHRSNTPQYPSNQPVPRQISPSVSRNNSWPLPNFRWRAPLPSAYTAHQCPMLPNY